MLLKYKNILFFISLSSITLLSNGCVAKNPDGTYSSLYSYHPYAKKQKKSFRRRYHRPMTYRHANVNNIEKTAKSLLGTDYQYGANGPYQYDCSSFTKYVFSKNGITLPRVSKDQAKVGLYVRANELKKGDLIFFDSKKSSEVSHVGIYLDRGYFIHASSAKDKVTISNLNSRYYRKHFKWGRRVTNMSYARR